jgi:hypothetical protein
MKTFVRCAVVLTVAAAMCQLGMALAADIHWVSGDAQSVTLIGDQEAAANPAPCDSCGQAACGGESCESCCCKMGCDGCPAFGMVGFAGLDSFKGISDGSYEGNFGAVTGVNSALPIGDVGHGWQLGMSYGVYDFDGRGVLGSSQARSQQQVFVTTGFFHKADDDRRLSFGLVYDWMINDQWGVFGTTPTLGQWRGQIEYALSGRNAVGFWGCIGDRNSQQIVGAATIRTSAISQANLFWHHKFCAGADSWLWVGIPESDRLGGDGSLGDWTVGASVQVPLSERMALYANGSYFRPSASAGVVASVESGYDVGMGIAWYFGGGARSHAINGACKTPYMPVANNSTFLVDQFPTYYP